MLHQALERLWVEVSRLNRPVVEFRAPGVSENKVKSVLECPVPDDVVTWFGWSNGIKYAPGQVQDDAALVPGYEPLSLSEAKAVRDSHGVDDPILGGSFVPLLATGGGDFYAAVCGSPSAASKVAHAMIGDETIVVYDGLLQMVNAFCDFYRTGVFFVSDEGTLEADDYRWVEIETGDDMVL